MPLSRPSRKYSQMPLPTPVLKHLISRISDVWAMKNPNCFGSLGSHYFWGMPGGEKRMNVLDGTVWIRFLLPAGSPFCILCHVRSVSRARSPLHRAVGAVARVLAREGVRLRRNDDASSA